MQDQVLETGGVFFDLVDHGLAELLDLLVGPVLAVHLWWHVLHEHRHEVLARGRHGGVGERRNQHVDVRVL